MGRIGKAETALKLYSERESNELSLNDIVKMTGVPRSTIYAKAKEQGLGSYKGNLAWLDYQALLYWYVFYCTL
jgi:hypothetical protein